MEPELLADYACNTGEGPLWHPTENRVYWVDIPSGRLFRYDVATGAHEMCYQAATALGGFTIQDDGSLLLFLGKGAVQRWHDGALTTVIDELPDELASRFNDVIADPAGRVFCGTMSMAERRGRLYRLDTDGTIHVVQEDIGCSNGMGFTHDHKHMYYTDSDDHVIYLFDYDAATGAITNRRVFATVPDAEGEGVPDGMTVDAAGDVWSARWNGSCLVRYTPDGTEAERIHFPAKKVSSVTFGGPDYTDMYVTTAGGDHKEIEGQGAGALFRLRGVGRGVPEFLSKVQA